MSTAVVAAIIAAAGVGVTLIWNWLNYLSNRHNQLARERMDAYAGLLAALHVLNNAHQLDREENQPTPTQLQAAREARDEVWRHQARIHLIAPAAIREVTEELVEEYQSSSLDREVKRRRTINRDRRKELRNRFVESARDNLPGVR